MKILYLANGLPHYFNLVLSKLNLTADLEVVVVVPKGPGKYIGDGVFQTRQGTDFRIIELEEYSAWRFFAGFRGLPGLLLRERPAVVVMPEHLLAGFFLNPLLAAARKFTGTRLILKSIPFHVPDYETALKRISSESTPPVSRLAKFLKVLGIRKRYLRAALELRRFCLRNVDAHVNYIDAARDIYGSYGVAPEKVFVTRNSPDTDAMARSEATLLASKNPPKRSAYRFLHVGRLVTQKRVDLLLDALPLVREKFPKVELVIVGDGPQRPAFEQKAAQLGITGAVKFVGPVYDALELGRYYMSASSFVLPGLGGLSINEAMFYGMAVVCSSGDGTEKFLVRERYNGSFFQADDRVSLAEAMSRLIEDQAELERMGARSRQIVDQEVNIHTVIAGYLEAFRHACA